MKPKKHRIFKIILIFIGVMFVSFKAIIYSGDFISYTKHESIQEKYHLNLYDSDIPMNTEWKYYKYSRWSLIDDSYYLLRNPFVRLFDIPDENNYTAVIILLADNKYTFQNMRDNITNNEILVKQNIDYRGMDVELKLLRSLESIPYCSMDFLYDNKYYRVIFYPNGYHEGMQFFASGSEIYPDVLDVYLRYLDEIIV